MEYTHGSPLLGLAVRVRSIEEYASYVRQYVQGSVGADGKLLVIDLDKGWSVANSQRGGEVDPENPPPRIAMRYIHRVDAKHVWFSGKTKTSPGKKVEDSHVFYFDVTPALTGSLKDGIEAKLRIKREEKPAAAEGEGASR